MGKKVISREPDDLVHVLVGSDLLYLSLVAGVIPTLAVGENGPVEREAGPADDAVPTRIPASHVAMEISLSDWEMSQSIGLVAVHDVRRFIFGDDKIRDHLVSNMSVQLGYPAFPPPMITADGVEVEHENEGAARPVEPKDVSEFVDSAYSNDAAVALVLLEQLSCISDAWPDEYFDSGEGDIRFMDRSAILEILAYMGGVDEATASIALEWASGQSTSMDDSAARLDELVSLLEQSVELKAHLDGFRRLVQEIMDGERMADPRLLLDEGAVMLRALGVLFRPADMKLDAVVDFLDSEADAGTVGPRIRAVSAVLAAATTGGFKSLKGPFKTVEDLYAIGSCMSAGQFDRVQLRRTTGPRGFEVLLDGEVLRHFQDEPDSREARVDHRVDLIDLFRLRAKRAGYEFAECSEDLLAAATGDEEELSYQRYLINDVIYVEFDSADKMRFQLRIDFNVHKGRRKKFPAEFLEKLSSVRKGGDLVCDFPRMSLYRDHFGHDLDEDELRGHVDSLIAGIGLVEKIWNDLNDNGSKKKAGGKVVNKKSGRAKPVEDQMFLEENAEGE